MSSMRLTSENGGNIQTYKDGLQVPQGASWGFPGSVRLPRIGWVQLPSIASSHSTENKVPLLSTLPSESRLT